MNFSEEAAEDYDLSTQYQWFCRLAQPLVEYRLENDPEFAKVDWIVLCFDSIEEFERLFPDRDVCQRTLQKMEVEFRQAEEPIHPVEILKIWPQFLKDMEKEENA